MVFHRGKATLLKSLFVSACALVVALSSNSPASDPATVATTALDPKQWADNQPEHARQQQQPHVPMQLVYPDTDHRFLLLNESALAWLSTLREPLVVVAAAGPVRSGKSFLLNALSGHLHGFAIGPTVDPMTRGLWFTATRAIQENESVKTTLHTERQDQDQEQEDEKAAGQEEQEHHRSVATTVVYLDTEGFSGTDANELYDAKIFALATFLSDVLLYNTVKTIDQASIDTVEMLARRAHLFGLRATTKQPPPVLPNTQEQEQELDDLPRGADVLAFPHLVWVAQDFVSGLGTHKDADAWLQSLLAQPHHRIDASVVAAASSPFFADQKQGHHHRTGSPQLFSSVHCRPLFLPHTEKEALQHLGLVRDPTEWTADYHADLRALKDLLTRLVAQDQDQGTISSLTTTSKHTNGKETGFLARAQASFSLWGKDKGNGKQATRRQKHQRAPLTGPALVALLRFLVGAANAQETNGVFPGVPNVWHAFVQLQIRLAQEDVLAHFRAQTRTRTGDATIPLTDAALHTLLTDQSRLAKERLQQQLHDWAIVSPTHKQESIQSLQKQLDQDEIPQVLAKHTVLVQSWLRSRADACVTAYAHALGDLHLAEPLLVSSKLHQKHASLFSERVPPCWYGHNGKWQGQAQGQGPSLPLLPTSNVQVSGYKAASTMYDQFVLLPIKEKQRQHADANTDRLVTHFEQLGAEGQKAMASLRNRLSTLIQDQCHTAEKATGAATAATATATATAQSGEESHTNGWNSWYRYASQQVAILSQDWAHKATPWQAEVAVYSKFAQQLDQHLQQELLSSVEQAKKAVSQYWDKERRLQALLLDDWLQDLSASLPLDEETLVHAFQDLIGKAANAFETKTAHLRQADDAQWQLMRRSLSLSLSVDSNGTRTKDRMQLLRQTNMASLTYAFDRPIQSFVEKLSKHEQGQGQGQGQGQDKKGSENGQGQGQEHDAGYYLSWSYLRDMRRLLRQEIEEFRRVSKPRYMDGAATSAISSATSTTSAAIAAAKKPLALRALDFDSPLFSEWIDRVLQKELVLNLVRIQGRLWQLLVRIAISWLAVFLMLIGAYYLARRLAHAIQTKLVEVTHSVATTSADYAASFRRGLLRFLHYRYLPNQAPPPCLR